MNFCFVINNKYVNHLIVTFTSVIINNQGNHNAFILYSDLTKNSIEKLSSFFKSVNCNVIFKYVNDECLNNVPILRADFNRTPYYKLLIPDEIPDTVERLLYMDVDIIVDGNLSDLFNIDLGGNCFAAVPDPLINKRDKDYKKRLGMSDTDKYFNSGLILFNMPQFRKKFNINAALEYIKVNGNFFRFHDQEVLNGMLFSEYYKLDERFNYLTVYRGFKDVMVYFLYKYFKKDIRIYHYANLKPWDDNYIGKYEAVYWKYTETSCVYEELLSGRKNSVVHQLVTGFSKLKNKICKK